MGARMPLPPGYAPGGLACGAAAPAAVSRVPGALLTVPTTHAAVADGGRHGLLDVHVRVQEPELKEQDVTLGVLTPHAHMDVEEAVPPAVGDGSVRRRHREERARNA